MVVYAGQGDARRSMALLWRGERPDERPAPGPKPELSVDLIVDTAVAVADEHGMAALSMRAVAERLGRSAMSLYTYVASKNELIDLMYDHAFAELADAVEGETERPWRTAATAWAEHLWRFSLRHPWTLQVSHARPVLGPHEYRVFEALALVLDRAGLGPSDVRNAFGSLFNLVRGLVRTSAEARQALAATGTAEDEWWHARSAQLEEVAPDFDTRFPTLAAMAEGGAFANDDEDQPYLEQEAWQTLRFGMGALLDGIERRLTATTDGQPR
ncbi:TetR family transcriptional regulator [Nocardiopsis sp. CNR-923]|uniref:TetR/AcrR family transcriptional regulator n=1 Tax=Nocardiopsis sp. CNR-923 TaxID=1904965 RepID=UPI00095E2B06|nr:TetR/AcrR family transcriptional regulator [Nocardiopsis sp. CNR-923]OLT27570.1 TetR family transcriptional regulator [Nocardiopsis sp. CNR-923]